MNQGLNPFEPPKAEWESEPVSHLRDASQGARFVNLLVDTGVLWSIATALALLGLGEEVLSMLLVLAYYPFFETVYGKTPGKWLTKTRVVTDDEEKPTLRHILVRTLVRYIPFEPFSFFFRIRGWHDVWSGTRVVSERKSRRRRRRR